MNRLNSKVTFAEAEGESVAPVAVFDDPRPLYRDNLIYLPFARHLSEIDEAAEQEQRAKAA